MRFYKDKTNVLILSHFLINPLKNAASSTSIRNFLLNKVKKIVQIEQPFPNSKEKFSYFLVFEGGQQKKSIKIRAIKKPGWLAYLVHLFMNLYFVLKTFERYDLCIACENLSFLAVLPLRKISLIRKLVYYSVDYVDERFANRLINWVYHGVDRIACKNSDVNWVVVHNQITAREKNGISIEECARFEIVPIGFRNKEIKLQPFNKIDYYQLVFCGALRETAGIQLAIEALPLILRKFPKVRLTLIGSGNYERELKDMVRKLGLKKYVNFLGAMVEHQKVVEILTKGSIGLAPYAPIPGSLSYLSDPGKIKLYLACGLPIITTKIATSGPVLVKKKAGMVIDYSKIRLYQAVSFLLGDRKRYETYRKNAISLSKKYDLDTILATAFKEA